MKSEPVYTPVAAGGEPVSSFAGTPVAASGKAGLIKFQEASKYRTLYEKSKANYWQPETIDLQSDKNQWLQLDKSLKRKVMGLLQYAILLDSYQVTNIAKFCVTAEDPMLSALLSFHSLMEAVHSQSYAYWIESICTAKQKAWLYQEPGLGQESRFNVFQELENSCGDTLANYFLEGVSFQALFRLSDQLKAKGLLPGLSAILTLIKRDEDTHIETFQHILRSSNEPLRLFHAIEFKLAYEKEAEQIFSITGDQELSDYVLYAGQIRLKAIGLLDKVTAVNPLKHLEKFNDVTKANLKANFFTSNVSYEQKDTSLNWDEDSWFSG